MIAHIRDAYTNRERTEVGNVFYTGEDFPARPFTVTTSLYETLNRLEEHYWSIRKASKQEVREAIGWVKDQFEPGSGWTKTDYDKEQTGGYRQKSGRYIKVKYLKLPTREGKINHGILIPLYLFLYCSDKDLKKEIREMFLQVYPGPLNGRESAVSGRFCCESCNIQYQRALNHISPETYSDLEGKFIQELEQSLTPTLRWKKYPFYYTVLSLHDIGTPAVLEFLHKAASMFNWNKAEKYNDNDRKSLMRYKAISVLKFYL